MIKRPLALSAVVFVLILSVFLLWNDTLFWRDPVKSNVHGEKQIAGFSQDDTIQVYGVISDYDYNDRYGQTTTEIILTDVHILTSHNTNDKSYISSNADSNKYLGNDNNEIASVQNGSIIQGTSGIWNDRFKKVTRSGQNILLYINKEETLSIGETILVSGKLFFFEAATNPGQFDAEKYYKNKDTLFAVKKAVIEKRTGESGSFRQKLKIFANEQEERLDYLLSDAYASILKAMLFGNKKQLDEETKELYQDNGIAHILAISGLHISLLGMSVYRLLRRLPFPHWISLFGSELFLLLYGCMVGFSASAFRAIGMFTFFLVSKICKRSYDMLTAVAFVAILQLLIHPGYLFDCGFQLSYAAILGMGILLPAFQELIKVISISWIQKCVSLILPSLSVTLLTAPILIYHYHELSFFSILLNVIVIPFTGVLLLMAIAMIALSYVCIPLAFLFSVPVQMILAFYEYSCRFLEIFSIGQKNIAHPSFMTIICYYCLLFAMTVLVKKKRNWYQFLFPVVASVLLLYQQNPDFTVWTLDVGQGDCSVIFTKEGNCFVIDCGSTSEYNVGEKRLIPFLKYQGVGKVDAVFVTHADADHMNGVVELLACGAEENIDVSCVMVHEQNGLEELIEQTNLLEVDEDRNGEVFAQSSEIEKWQQLVEAANVAGIPIVEMGQGDCVQTDSMSLTCLYPLDEQNDLTGNASSMVLSLEAETSKGAVVAFSDVDLKNAGSSDLQDGVFRALFTGDLEMDGEVLLLDEYGKESTVKQNTVSEGGSMAGQDVVSEDVSMAGQDVVLGMEMKYDLLKVGHHGSSGSSSVEFLEWAASELAVISCSKDNSYGHPHAETLKRLETVGSKIFCTAECGAISIKSVGELEVKSWGGSH